MGRIKFSHLFAGVPGREVKVSVIDANDKWPVDHDAEAENLLILIEKNLALQTYRALLRKIRQRAR